MSLTKTSFSMISNAPINVLDYMNDALKTAITTNTYTTQQKTDVYNGILAAETATAAGAVMYWPNGTYDIGSNVWTPALKKIKHVGQGGYEGGTVLLKSSGAYTILTSIGNDVDASRATTFEGLQITNTNTNGACVYIRNGGLIFNDCVINCTGANGEGVLIGQMFAMTWKQNFISGNSSSMRMYSTGTSGAGTLTSNNNTFIGCNFQGEGSGQNGLILNAENNRAHIKANSFIGCNFERVNRGILNNAMDNVFISANIEPFTSAIEETATASATYIMPRVTLGSPVTLSELTECIPPNYLYSETLPRQFAGTTLTVYRGITFPSTYTSYPGANTLNDYEEGEWTATFTCGTSGTITLATQNKGSYIQIGRTVTVSGQFIVASVSSPVGSLTINGLPFSGGANSKFRNAVAISSDSLTSGATTSLQGFIQGTATIIVSKFAAGATSNLAGDIQAGSNIFINATYIIDII